jgi:acyl transferase domain-containing protein/acyl carrier protein
VEAIATLQERLARRGIAGKRLAVSHAFHSAMMDPILGAFAAEVRKVELQPPAIPFLSNLTGRWIRPEEATDPDYWVRHLRGTVRFAEGMSALLEDPARVYLEAGPGRSLANAARQVRPGQVASAAFAALPEPGDTLPEPAWSLLTLGRLWTAGVEVDWPALHAGRPRRRVPLPTYPFEHRRYWVEIPEAPDASAAGPRVAEDSADWFHVPYWRPSLPAGNGPAGPRLLFLDRTGLGRRLERRLREHGIETVTVEPGEGFARAGERSYVLHPGKAEDYEALFADLGARDLFPGEVVHLWNVDSSEDVGAGLAPAREGTSPSPTSKSVQEAELLAFHSPLLLGHALAGAASRPVRVLLVSTGLHAVTGREAVEPAKGLLLAPCRVMPQRFTGLSCRVVDVELEPGMEEEIVRLLRAETAAGGDEPVVAIRGRRRWAQDFTPQRLDLPGPSDRFREGGVWVVTGGLGGVGYTLASLLYERCRARLVIVGRSLSADPGSRAAGRLHSLEQRGAEVLLVAADVANPEALREVRRQAEERFGAIHGILHAAGVPGPGMIDWSRPEAAAETLRAKVRGTLALAAAFEGAPLDAFVLCSSLSSLLGGIGQVGYAAGNAFLDAFAWSRSADPRTLTVSIDWPLWRDVGFEAEARGEHANRQRSASGLSSRQAVEAFQRILGYGFPQIAVSHIDVRDLMAAGRSWETSGFRAIRREGRTEETAAAPAPPPSRPASPAAPMDDVEEAIAGVWRELLGIREVSAADDFFALGGDSLIALGLSARLHDRFRVELAPGDVYGAATLGELAELVRKQLATVTT